MQKKNLYIIIIGVIAAILVGGALYATTSLLETSHVEEIRGVKESVKNTIKSFDGDLDSVVLTHGKYYSFVLTENLDKIVLHPREELVNTKPIVLHDANISLDEMRKSLKENGFVWIDFEFLNPQTGNIEPKTAYFKSYEGYVFGAGYYHP